MIQPPKYPSNTDNYITKRHPNELNPVRPKNLPPIGISLNSGPRGIITPKITSKVPDSDRSSNPASLEESLSKFKFKYSLK